MSPILKALLGILCLLLGPVFIFVTTTAMLDMVGVVVLLIGLWLIAASIISTVRRSRPR